MIVNTNAGRRPLRGGPIAFQKMLPGGQRGAMQVSQDSGAAGFGVIGDKNWQAAHNAALRRIAIQRKNAGLSGFGTIRHPLPSRRTTPTYAQTYHSGADYLAGFGVFPHMRRQAPVPMRQRGSMQVSQGFDAFPDARARMLEGFGAFPYMFHGFGDDTVEEMTPPTDAGTNDTTVASDGASTMSTIDSILSSGAKLGQAYTSYLTRNKPVTTAPKVVASGTSGIPTWMLAVGGVALLGGAYLLLSPKK